MRRPLPLPCHLGQKPRAARRGFMEDLLSARSVEADCRCADERSPFLGPAAHRIDERRCCLHAALENSSLALRRPARTDVFADDVDHRIGARDLIDRAPGDAPPGSHCLGMAADDHNFVASLQQLLHERASDEAGAAGHVDLHASGDYRPKDCAPPEQGGASV